MVRLATIYAALDLSPVIHCQHLLAALAVWDLPIERKVRHTLELARSYSVWNRREEALSLVLDAGTYSVNPVGGGGSYRQAWWGR